MTSCITGGIEMYCIMCNEELEEHNPTEFCCMECVNEFVEMGGKLD